ncbi:MAG: hypothetical protein AAFY84_01345 [Pseudomonadota bacterium]
MEPSLRNSRYVVAFNRLLDRYTSFNFNVAYIKYGCIHVGFEAQNYASEKKNEVRQQIRILLKTLDLQDDYRISYLQVFGNHQFIRTTTTS